MQRDLSLGGQGLSSDNSVWNDAHGGLSTRLVIRGQLWTGRGQPSARRAGSTADVGRLPALR